MKKPDLSHQRRQPRRQFLSQAAVATALLATSPGRSTAACTPQRKRAQIAITLDLEMSRHYPRREMMEWDYQKGNLNEPTKKYALEAARVAKDLGGLIHYFCVGRVLEQQNVDWLEQIAAMGHPIGNHTYDHVNVWRESQLKHSFVFSDLRG